ncbi:MAG TPA: response regulator transcription factor [Anaerolineae bacterium]|jgi:DNA-binding NarL/FixJ family response regulator
MSIRILLVDDHKIVREGTRQLLEQSNDLTIVAETSRGEDAVRLCDELSPDVVVMDVHMPGMNGLEATRVIRASHPAIRVLILSAYDDDRYIFPLLDTGANGYLLKTASGADLADAIRAVFRGETALDPQIIWKVRTRYSQSQIYRSGEMTEGLTEREMSVLRQVASGKTNKEVGETLGISNNTVQVHLRNIFGKIGVNDRLQAVAFAMRQGWISFENEEF